MRSPIGVLLVLSAFVFLVGGCSNRLGADVFDFSLLIGRWSSADSISSQLEEWRQVNDSTFSGRGYVLEGGDTTFFESLEINKVHGVWTYAAKVDQLNGVEVIPFALYKQSARRVEFYNAQHDFPKKIGYELTAEDELQAYIEGPRNGQTIRILFDFKKNQ
jgi:hypothetical protein